MTFLFLASKGRLIYVFPKPVNLDEKILHWGAFSSSILPVFHLEEGLGERAQSRASSTGCVRISIRALSCWFHLPPLWLMPLESAEKDFEFQGDLILQFLIYFWLRFTCTIH